MKRSLSLTLGCILTLTALAAKDVRVVSLSSPLAEAMYSLGAQKELVGVSDVCVFPEQILADRKSGKVAIVGSFMSPNVDRIVALHPDVILTSTSFQTGLAQRLRERGYKVLHFEPHSLNDILDEISEIGAAVGKRKEALDLVSTMRAERAALSAKAHALAPVKVYLEINHEGPWTVGSASPLEDLIEAAGGENIFADRHEGAFVTSHEEVVRRNPGIILSPIWLDAKLGGMDGITTLASIFARPGYAATRAVLDSRVLYYDSALLKHEGPRQILAIRKLAYLLHPDVFPNPPGTIPWELGRIRP